LWGNDINDISDIKDFENINFNDINDFKIFNIVINFYVNLINYLPSNEKRHTIFTHIFMLNCLKMIYTNLKKLIDGPKIF
jgi:hypothetical protein